jgi:hypothetical protein
MNNSEAKTHLRSLIEQKYKEISSLEYAIQILEDCNHEEEVADSLSKSP